MSEPVIASKKPSVLKLEAGSYWYCRCGRSKSQPFCDGAHKGTGFSPMEFSLDKAKTVVLCNCKHTGDEPYCDGSHKGL